MTEDAADDVALLLAQFDELCSAGRLPQIADYLERVDLRERPSVLRELLRIEARHRQNREGQPRPAAEADSPGRLDSTLSLDGRVPGRATAPPPRIQQIDRFAILAEIGRGGMGVVYRAHDSEMRRDVAIKVMHPRFCEDPRLERRFTREVSAMSQLVHRRIVQFITAGEEDDLLYLVMEYVPTIELFDLLASRSLKLRLSMTTGLMVQVLEALEYAHGQGWLHRDLKPANVLVEAEGRKLRAKVSDFGLAKSLERAGFSSLTQEGEALGSVPYMAPEQVRGARDVTATADVFSAGATLYAWLTGQTPVEFSAGCDPLSLAAECQIVPIQERLPGLPPRLCGLVHRALARDPLARFRSASEMRHELERARKSCLSA